MKAEAAFVDGIPSFEYGYPVDPPALATELPYAFHDCDWTAVVAGMSGADVFRLSRRGKPIAYLKSDGGDEVAGEATRALWLGRRQGVKCARLLAAGKSGNVDWMLTKAARGAPLAEYRSPGCAAAMAIALRSLHAIDPSNCPFDGRLAVLLGSAAARVSTGLVEGREFARLRLPPPRDLLAKLEGTRPPEDDLVVAHGDACMPNFMAPADLGDVTLIDCGRLGVADRHRDLSLAVRSLAHNVDRSAAEAFLDAYGRADVNSVRLEYYELLDELL